QRIRTRDDATTRNLEDAGKTTQPDGGTDQQGHPRNLEQHPTTVGATRVFQRGTRIDQNPAGGNAGKRYSTLRRRGSKQNYPGAIGAKSPRPCKPARWPLPMGRLPQAQQTRGPWDELPFHEEDNDPILGTTRRGW